MSLQGTFDTLSVTELFSLLSTAGKTGALRLEAGEHEASLLVRAGRCCAVDEAARSASVSTEVELAARLVDVGFTLGRQPAGSFRFSDTEVAPSDVTVAFEPAVVEIAAMLEAWKDIEATIPSLDARLRIAPVLRDEQIVLRADEWALVAGLHGTPSVRDLVSAGTEPLLAVCRRVKDLVDRGAIEVEVGVAPAPSEQTPARPPVAEPEATGRSALEAASAGLLDAVEPYAPEAIEPEPEPVPVRQPVVVREPVPEREPVAVAAADRSSGGGSGGADLSDDPSSDRGALLRLFSALKD